ncbi:hypothetical protein [Chryseobacterium cheonjiense]|uniref:Uncharacterized protein n=1 Tax=Chryseobacterium cheonjiense TaxID=2728845 RepID=A0A7Y0A4W4_9FLAO|nr:hypothetical protein [Chryseobacterium cheonjiense]NML56745.1 hypothetical protein [Chryseobacterium cheonjiense]
MNDQRVEVVSGNNSATRNGFEKPEKNVISFIATPFGRISNKDDVSKMIKNVSNIYSEFSLRQFIGSAFKR